MHSRQAAVVKSGGIVGNNRFGPKPMLIISVNLTDDGLILDSVVF